MLVAGFFLPAVAKHAGIFAVCCAWRWQAGMLDNKKGKASLFNPVSSDQYPVSARVYKQSTSGGPQKLTDLLSFRPRRKEV